MVLSPVLLLVALAIRLRDGAPVFFRQERVGLHGRPFRVVKFRTMVPDAEDQLSELEGLNEIRGPAFKLTDDPRLTRTGGWLRRTSIDELPQLWNVLRGEMSLVGPRPPLPSEVLVLRHLAPPAPLDAARHHRAVAGRRPPGGRLRPVGATRPRLHRPLVALAGPQDHGQDHPGRPRRRGSLSDSYGAAGDPDAPAAAGGT